MWPLPVHCTRPRALGGGEKGPKQPVSEGLHPWSKESRPPKKTVSEDLHPWSEESKAPKQTVSKGLLQGQRIAGPQTDFI